MPVDVPADAKVGDTVTLKGQAHFLVCKDICIPQDVDLSIPMKIGDGAADPANAKDFADARAQMPVTSPWKLTYASAGSNVSIYAEAPALAAAHPVDVVFFPLKTGLIKGTAPQTMAFTKDGLVLKLTQADKACYWRQSRRRAGADLFRQIGAGAECGCGGGRGA